jgi:malonyl-CoA O-methyltransferase
MGGSTRQLPQVDVPAGTRSAQRRQRGNGSTNRALHASQTRRGPQPWQIAHCVGRGREVGCDSRRVNTRAGEEVEGGSIYCRPMPDAPRTPTRPIDDAALRHVLRRLGRAASAPWLHEEVARRMAQRLALIKLQPQSVLDWWSFLGAGGEGLARAYPAATRVMVEPDAALAERSRATSRGAWWSPKRWRGPAVVVAATGDEIPGGMQLVWSNMMLHAEPDPPALIARWQHALAADGFVMFSCFGPDTVKQLRELYRRLGWPAPTIPFVDMHDLGDMLVQAGFADPVMDQETITLSWASPQALLAELRTLGGNVSPQRFAGLRTPRWRARLEHELGALAGADGRLQLGFEVAYGHAFKALPRVRTDAPTTVSLDDMRALVKTPRTRP